MNTADYVIIALVAAALVFALAAVIRNRKNGKTCSGDCGNCHNGCEK